MTATTDLGQVRLVAVGHDAFDHNQPGARLAASAIRDVS
jgi:hypothetical protein